MDSTIIVRVMAGVLALGGLAIVVYRRKKTA
jgi:LPXTG-motif cell wall-anchored protein